MKKKILYKIQNDLLQILFYILSYLEPKQSSFLIGKIFSFIGPFLPLNKIVRRNLEIAFPECQKINTFSLEKRIWENLGRNFGELPHLKAIKPKIKIIGSSHLQAAKATHRPVIFVSAHFGNWEIMPSLLAREGLSFAPVFRAPNNPYLNQFLIKIRQNLLQKNTPIFTKGAKDVRKILAHLKSGKHLGMLIDQKMNDGIALQFFQRKAMSSNATISLAMRAKALIVSGHMERNSKGDLTLIVDPPIDLPQSIHTEKQHEEIQKYSQFLNNRIEEWIKNTPSIWLWMHRRWDKSLYQSPQHQ
ncbi:lauroyl acyltransferase [Acetobacteraceae bacterium]|nr:lauroyl acyltransferase [Acetobacteraceae bacterium]